MRAPITSPSNFRNHTHLNDWLKLRGLIGISGIDTRALTAWIRENGMPNAVIAHDPAGVFDIDQLKAEAKAWSGLEGLDLAKVATSGQSSRWNEKPWLWNQGYSTLGETDAAYHVVALDYGVKRNILRALSSIGARVTVVPAKTTAEEVLARKPDGVLLSNGPGDPVAIGQQFEDEATILVDAMGEGFEKVAELRLFKASEGDVFVYSGTLRIPGLGAWAVSCDPNS